MILVQKETCSDLGKLHSPHSVADLIEWRRVQGNGHDIGNDEQEGATDTGFRRDANLREETSYIWQT